MSASSLHVDQSRMNNKWQGRYAVGQLAISTHLYPERDMMYVMYYKSEGGVCKDWREPYTKL